MYNKILSDIKQEYYQKNYPNDGQRFVAWYLRNIHNLDTYETKECITDGADDKQIDAIYIDNQTETIYIIQGKFYSGNTVDAEPLREVISSWIQIKDLAHLQEGANEKLQIKISEIANAIEDDYKICFELITTSELTPSAQRDLEIFQKELADNENFQANLYVVDNETLRFKYEEALNKDRPYINYRFHLEKDKYMQLALGGTKVVIAALPLKECINIPGIKDGRLFRKNVRQSLGSSNNVNKKIAATIKKDANNFFFLHNGITAICSKMSIDDDMLWTEGLNVVNGCQSLSTIFMNSEYAKKSLDAYIMFRFYEIETSEQADKISTSTNSQSAVKPRDLRSNDKSVIAMKKAYEQCYTDGYFITKRGEKADKLKYNPSRIVNLTDLGKQLMAWHSQRPTISYSESKIFDKYFDQLFRREREYTPENILALHTIFTKLYEQWNNNNPMGLNETLLAMKAYAPYHQLYAISAIFSELNNMNNLVPCPTKALIGLQKNNNMELIIKISGKCLDNAMKTAASEAQLKDRIFSAQNWIKSKTSLSNIRAAISNYLTSLEVVPEAQTLIEQLKTDLSLNKDDFEARWSAD